MAMPSGWIPPMRIARAFSRQSRRGLRSFNLNKLRRDRSVYGTQSDEVLPSENLAIGREHNDPNRFPEARPCTERVSQGGTISLTRRDT